MNRLIISAAFLGLSAIALAAQNGGISLNTSTFDRSLPVEVTADSLAVSQEAGKATFSGQARVKQGDLRLGAEKITVIYSADQSQIVQISAEGNVLFTNGIDTAEAQIAEYNVDAASILMSGNVLLLQGATAISGDQLELDLSSGQAAMQGNVRTKISAN